MSDKKWKSQLLSSSFPLKYEAAKILASKHFFIDSDYTYGRAAESGETDFSVDVLARGFPPFSEPDDVKGSLELLVECKHRVRGTKWLFLPDVNQGAASKIYLGGALRIFDDFCPYVVDHTPSYVLTNQTPCCYKGIEIKAGDSGVYDAEIRHGLEQLRYALPRLMANAILNNIMGHVDDNRPFLVCPILLTNAELFVAHKNLSVAAVEKADDPAELGKRVPCLISHAGYGPDFESHCQKAFKVLTDYVGHKKVQEVDDLRGVISDKVYRKGRPIAFMKALAIADCTPLEIYFTQFMVCTRDGFPRLVDKLKRLTVQVMDSRTDMNCDAGRDGADRAGSN